MSEPTTMSELAKRIGICMDDLGRRQVEMCNEVREGNRQIRLLCRLMESFDKRAGDLDRRLEQVTRVLEGRDEPWGRPWETEDND